jgi:hypothetical protein
VVQVVGDAKACAKEADAAQAQAHRKAREGNRQVSATLVQFPEREIDDIPRMLRRLAEQIEAGQYDEANNVAWVIDCGNGRIELGMMGRCKEPGAEAHLLLSLGINKIEAGAICPLHSSRGRWSIRMATLLPRHRNSAWT